VQRILAGQFVRAEVLDKVVRGLSFAMPSHAVTITDIPSE
jgi:hypothetical protein